MRTVEVSEVQARVKKMVQDINLHYPNDVLQAIQQARTNETQARAQTILDALLENAKIAEERHLPICQDTGMVVLFLEVGQEVHFQGGSLVEAIHQGIREGYAQGYLRKSVVQDPLFGRINTQDNTPAIIHTSIVEGDQVVLHLGVKGFGSENMSRIYMLKPAEGIEGVKAKVLETIQMAGPNACPPFVVGVGIGGDFELAAQLAKKATFRSLQEAHPQAEYAALESELFTLANQLNIGPQGLKGDTTVLKVNIERYPTHIAGLPVAVNISCHVTRHALEVL
ncbi:MAG: fumarate hydratase [Erysipelotrichaceae bacterium]